MKSFIKLTTAALALVTLASCSNDDLFGNSNSIAGEKTLQLNVEQMGGTSITRTAYDASNQRIWQEGDVFKAYDGELYKYDYYEYKKASNAFEIQKGTDKDLDDPQYVLFPADKVKTTAWNKADKSVTAYMTLDAEYDYADVAGENGTEYISNLPLWGTAAADATYGVSADVYFMTGILKISLDNVPDNADAIEVQAYEDIEGTKKKQLNGEFVALLDKVNVKNVYLKSNAAATADNNKITVSLTEAGKKDTHSVIFLPIPAGHYGQLNVVVKKDGTEVYAKNYVDKDIERNKVYAGAKKSFEAAAVNVNKLNTLLATFANSATGDAELEVSTQTAVGEDAEVGNTVVVPAMKATSLTLNLNKMNGNSSETLTFSGAYAGNFILNIPETANISNIAINMPNANVTIASLLTSFSGGINLIDAKSVTFAGYDNAGKEQAKDYSTHNIEIKAEVGDITIGSKATVGAITLAANHRTESLTVEGVAGAITIAEAAAHKCNVVVSGKAGAIANNGEGDITISGYAGNVTNKKGAITISGYCEDVTSTEGDITISGDPIWNDPRTGKTYAKTANVTAKKGNVTVDLTADKEGAAISGTLKFNSNANLTLNNGYIAAVTVTGPTATGATVKVTNGAAGYTSLGTVTLTGAKDFLKIQNASVWNGKNIGGGISKPGSTDTYTVDVVKTAYEAYNDANRIYTATEFAYKLQGKTPGTWQSVCNDIDLDNKKFTPAEALNVKFVGNKSFKAVDSYPTISNLTLAECPMNAQDGYGLFKTAKGSMSYLNFDGITITMNKDGGCKNIGGIIGVLNATEAVTYSNITVKNVSITGTKLASAIGAFIGQLPASATDGATFTDVTVDGVKITGYNEIGGFIGEVLNGALVKFAKGGTDKAPTFCSAKNIKVTQLTDPSKDNADASLAKVGTFIGFTDSQTATNVEINLATLPGDTGYTVTNASAIAALSVFPKTVGDGVKTYPIVRWQTLIGYCGNVTTTKVTLKDNVTGTGSQTGEYSSLSEITKAADVKGKYLDYIKEF